MKLVETAPHEFTANYQYNTHGLAPYFACDAVVKDGGGSMTGEFRHGGERWCARLSYRSSNIVHPGDETPAGTSWDLAPDDDTQIPTLRREFKIRVFRHPEEDDLGEQDFTAHIAPRWPGMKGLKKDGSTTDLAPPDEFGEGINCKVTGSNIEFDRYAILLQLGMDAATVSAKYLETPHENSNILDAERYVRIHRDESGPVHARDGPIAELGHVLENDRQGYRKVVQNDDDGHGRNLPGYYNTVTLGPRRIAEAWPGHDLPKEIKHYYAREAAGKDEDDPLAHPKLGASYQNSRTDETLSLSDLEKMSDELRETVHSVLLSAGIDASPVHGPGPFVEDAYFAPSVEEQPDPTVLDVTHIRQEQESVVVRHLSDGLSPVQWESLQKLVTDGGTVSPQDIADDHERHVGSVRRALRDMEDLVQRKYAEVGLKSDYVAEMVHDAVQEARESTRRAVKTAAKTMDAAERGLSQTMAEWVAWCERHGVDIRNRRDALEIDLGDLDADHDPSPHFLISQALEVWENAGQDPQRFRMAEVRVNGMSTTAFKLLK